MTTDTLEKQQSLITLSARALATAWLNAFLASSDEEDRPVLYRSLSLEFFRNGLHLIGCDGSALFRSWVPDSDDRPTWPDQSEAPIRSVVVMDPDGFGIGFMRALLRLTNDEERAHESISMSTLAADEGATLSLGEEFMTERLALRACGQRIDLRLFEADYPDWRKLRLGLEVTERVESLTVAPRLFGMIGKLKGVSAVDMEFYGEMKHVAFTARGATEVRGLMMPMRKPEKPLEQ